jgi:glycosyltransferase involved in cell wall biosynthesis
MKLIVQVPCYNEQAVLSSTLQQIPREIAGIDSVEVLVIDDGSSDDSANIARQNADHLISFKRNRGLAMAFAAGIDECLRLGADIIVNTDADNQYEAQDIPLLVGPILAGEADIVIGDRQTSTLRHFSSIKKKLQRLGSWVVRFLSGTKVPDATSGFRAYSRQAAMRMNVISEFTYTLETIIQAGKQKLSIVSVPIRTNETGRQSRLFPSIGTYVKRSAATIVRAYTMYQPLKVLMTLGLVLILAGMLFQVRFLAYFFLEGGGKGHIQSLIASAILIIVGFLISVIGILSDLIASNRKILEEILTRLRRIEYNDKDKSD